MVMRGGKGGREGGREGGGGKRWKRECDRGRQGSGRKVLMITGGIVMRSREYEGRKDPLAIVRANRSLLTCERG